MAARQSYLGYYPICKLVNFYMLTTITIYIFVYCYYFSGIRPTVHPGSISLTNDNMPDIVYLHLRPKRLI